MAAETAAGSIASATAVLLVVPDDLGASVVAVDALDGLHALGPGHLGGVLAQPLDGHGAVRPQHAVGDVAGAGRAGDVLVALKPEGAGLAGVHAALPS